MVVGGGEPAAEVLRVLERRRATGRGTTRLRDLIALTAVRIGGLRQERDRIMADLDG